MSKENEVTLVFQSGNDPSVGIGERDVVSITFDFGEEFKKEIESDFKLRSQVRAMFHKQVDALMHDNIGFGVRYALFDFELDESSFGVD